MELHITNNEAAQLASQLARATGHSIEEEVLVALRERVERVQTRYEEKEQWTADQAEALREKIQKIRERSARLPIIDTRPLDDILYDENGLPK